MDNNVVITTKSILNGKANIFEVYHDEDGTWQAIPKEDFTENDAKVISIKNLLTLDKSVEEILTLPPGYMARKENNIWVILKQDT